MKWSVKLTLAYHGGNYVGWQIQPNGASVQQTIEQAWFEVTGERIRITASGRTDSGVHALGQVCSCQTETNLKSGTLVRALNAMTPQDLCVLAAERAVDGFHAIRDAIGKTYRYRIQFDSPLSPFELDRSWYLPRKLDLDAMHQAAERLLGVQDFSSFETTGSTRNSKVRELSALTLKGRQKGSYKFLTIDMTANGFLYNMARTIVGTLVDVGQGRRTSESISDLLLACDRQAAGMTAPACGLYLVSVQYRPEHLATQP